jgi:hypothetical protein
MKDNTLTLRRMGTGHKVLKGLFVLAAMIGLLAFVCTPASAKKRNIPYNEHFMLHFSVGLKYSTSGENTSDLFKDNSTFTQNYSLGMDGYVLDPRLMAFSASTTFRHESISVPETKNVSTGGFNLNVSFINRLDRNKGLKLWKYMPAPISMNYSYYDYGSSTVTSFNLFTLYSMPGYVRMFGSGRFIFYDDGSRGKLDTNRYRVKYRKPSTTDNLDGNWNENEDWNGNWNGNGNGNGNWNGNGNGNWNGNWNRNGNGNWNGNWNRNGNGNWNGNWNRNEQKRKRKLERKLEQKRKRKLERKPEHKPEQKPEYKPEYKPELLSGHRKDIREKVVALQIQVSQYESSFQPEHQQIGHLYGEFDVC